MNDFKGIYTQKERDKRISDEYERLKTGLASLDSKNAVTLDKLFHEAAFMAITLEETRKIITRDGIIEQYQNGATQKGLKKSSAVEVYDKMMSTYLKTIDQINKSLPEGKTLDPAAELNEFLRRED